MTFFSDEHPHWVERARLRAKWVWLWLGSYSRKCEDDSVVLGQR